MRLRLDTKWFAVFALATLTGTLTPPAPAQQVRPATRPASPARAFGALPADPTPGDLLLEKYFRARTADIARASLADVRTAEDWDANKAEYRRQLADMLGLWPAPPRTDLKPVVTGTVDHAEFTVDKVQFQSMPGLYVTGSAYVPKRRDGKKLPTILYVCGHGNTVKDGVSYGSKVNYQHHGGWFARNGYVCMVIDTLQLGETQGVHHGLYREKMWWWISRGHTPAGVEAWNSIRALDYLQTRPEVDATRFGITGRSGGGAYSWWTAALDDRIKAAVPVAGITDVHNHVVDGVIEGHCDCMYMVNTYRWDFAKVAALVSPRPLLIANTDKDGIFPLDGVQRLHEQTRRIYRLQKADAKLGLLITEGGHQDTQDLQVPALRWFNRWLKKETGPVSNVAEKHFGPEQLKVFDKLPGDQRNTTIKESFVPKAPPPAVPENPEAWAKQRDGWLRELKAKTFGAWPTDAGAAEPRHLFSAEKNGVELHAFEVQSQPHVPVRVYVAVGAQAKPPQLVVLNVGEEKEFKASLSAFKTDFGDRLTDLDLPDADPKEAESTARMLKGTPWAMAYVAVRGVGPTAWGGDEKRQTHVRRRFALLGESLDGMRVWDVRQAVRAAGKIDRLKGSAVWLQGEGRMAGVALYASLFEPTVARLDLHRLAATHDLHADGPELLNVLRTLDVPAAVAMAAERSQVRIYRAPAQPADAWAYPSAVAAKLGWGADRVQVRDAGG